MKNEVILIYGFTNEMLKKYVTKSEQFFEYKITASVDQQDKIILFFVNNKDREKDYIKSLSRRNKTILAYETIPDRRILYQYYLYGVVASIDINKLYKLPQIISHLSDDKVLMPTEIFNMIKKEIKNSREIKKLYNQKQIMSKLTKTEQKIMQFLYQGYTRNEICELMCISINTTKTHIRNILKKLNVNSCRKAVEKLYELYKKY